MMRWCYLLAIIFTMPLQSFAEIREVKAMRDVFKHFEEAGEKETLAVFDLDMVLVQPNDPALQMANMKRYSPTIKRIIQPLSAEQKVILLNLMLIQSESMLLDENAPRLLIDLQEKGLKTMALTASLTGPFGSISSMEEWRLAKLQALGIGFGAASLWKDEIVFSDLEAFRGSYSVYKRGVLFANGSGGSKGALLTRFFLKVDYTPQKVIFVDDREENLKSVEEALQTLYPSVEFLGIHYTGAKDYPSPFIDEKSFELKWQQFADQAKQY